MKAGVGWGTVVTLAHIDVYDVMAPIYRTGIDTVHTAGGTNVLASVMPPSPSPSPFSPELFPEQADTCGMTMRRAIATVIDLSTTSVAFARWPSLREPSEAYQAQRATEGGPFCNEPEPSRLSLNRSGRAAGRRDKR